MDRHELVTALAALTEDEYLDVTADARNDGTELTPMEIAAAALRHSRGLDRKAKATPEQAAEALRRYATGI